MIAAASSIKGPVQPIPDPAELGLDPERVALGKLLFADARLSGDATVSCATCHVLALAGTDRLPQSRGIGGAVGKVNTPTVLNSGLLFRQFWDGRAATLEEQIDGPLQSPLEMGATWETAIGRLRADGPLVTRFARAYPEGLSASSVRDAIATFERSLLTPDSRFDKYLRGDDAAISPLEKEGYRLFQSHGCTACHHGVGIGGSQFARFGIMGDYFADRGNITEADLGRFNVTRDEADRHVFKVPSLRNVALTPPYFHDASAPDLHAAVRTMARYQLGRQMADDDLSAIVAFLETLTGDMSGVTP